MVAYLPLREYSATTTEYFLSSAHQLTPPYPAVIRQEDPLANVQCPANASMSFTRATTPHNSLQLAYLLFLCSSLSAPFHRRADHTLSERKKLERLCQTFV